MLTGLFTIGKKFWEWDLIATILFCLKVFSRTMAAKMDVVNKTNTA